MNLARNLLIALILCIGLFCGTKAQAASPSFSVEVGASPTGVLVKQTETITVTATANETASNYSIALTVTYNGAGEASKTYTDLNFRANTPIKETYSWSVPSKAALGTYTVTANVYKGSTTYDSATTTFAVVSPAVNGACGASNGADLTGKPTTGLCTAGTASTVSGSGPWSWSCAGSNGGSTASCSAKLVLNGACGSSNGAALSSAPVTGLCTAGTASAVSGSGPWSWSCAGSNGGSAASCSASLMVNGACGAANGVAVSTVPATGLCNAGNASSIGGTGPWSWSCVGINGGTTASCAAPLAVSTINGACGAANNVAVSSAPATGLCTTGTASGVGGTGPWTWTCAGSGGGTTASCAAPLAVSTINGACGAANNVAVSSAPATGLCTTGTASGVGGTGPWTWTCAGSGGGTTASCTAPLSTAAVNGTCGSMNGTFTNVAPTSNLCSAGTASTVSGNGPWLWSCVGSNGGTTANCQALPPIPTPAAAVGYNENTFSTNAFATSNVDMGATYASGFQWYLDNFFGSVPTAAHTTINSDGSITVGEGGNTYNATVSSAGYIGSSPNFVGTAIGGGAYIQAVIKFNAQPLTYTNGFPAFWATALEGLLGTSQWPGEPAGYNHNIETDIFEYYEGAWSTSLSSYQASLVDWYDGTNYGIGTTYTVPQANFSNYNTVAMLWVPATSTVEGYVNYYWNGNLVSTHSYTQLTSADKPPPSAKTPWAFGIIDQDHLVIEIGSNNTYPITIQSVNVWQASANSNMHN